MCVSCGENQTRDNFVSFGSSQPVLFWVVQFLILHCWHMHRMDGASYKPYQSPAEHVKRSITWFNRHKSHHSPSPVGGLWNIIDCVTESERCPGDLRNCGALNLVKIILKLWIKISKEIPSRLFFSWLKMCVCVCCKGGSTGRKREKSRISLGKLQKKDHLQDR